MTALRAVLRVLALLGLLSAEGLLLQAYVVRGTGWHWLLHTGIGLGLGLAAAAALGAATRTVLRPLPFLVAGQLVSAAPDLIFRFGLVPHRPWMDVPVGHVSIHTAPVPLVVAAAMVVTGGAAWHASDHGRRRAALVGAAATAGLLVGALLLADPLPTTLAEYAQR